MKPSVRVLHLEDDVADAQRIRAGLEEEGLACDIVWVQSPGDFVSALQGDACDLVLSDYEVGGLEMLPEVRAKRPDVPVIMITAYGDAETRRTALERGAEGLLTKPIDFGQLRQEIDARLGQAA